jgi:hypothetical protein
VYVTAVNTVEVIIYTHKFCQPLFEFVLHPKAESEKPSSFLRKVVMDYERTLLCVILAVSGGFCSHNKKVCDMEWKDVTVQ